MKPTKLLIADSQRMFSGALADALGQRPEIAVLEDRPVSRPAAVQAAKSLKPDVVLIDYMIEGPDTARDIIAEVPGCKVLFLSWMHAAGQIEEAMSTGAVGFLPKSSRLDQVAEAVRLAREGEGVVYPEQIRKLVETIDRKSQEAEDLYSRMDSLSRRQFQILILLGSGKLIQEIAKELGLTQNTVAAHIAKILKKTGARSHGEVIAMARAAGIIQT